MNIIQGDIWKFHGQAENNFVGITTNGYINSRGLAVMGRGVALQAAQKFPTLRGELAHRIKSFGNHVHYFIGFRLFTIPVKHIWSEDADPKLIDRSLFELNDMARRSSTLNIYMPKPGCGNGRLTWANVLPICQANLTAPNIFIVEYKPL